jgi:hypothetical protein
MAAALLSLRPVLPEPLGAPPDPTAIIAAHVVDEWYQELVESTPEDRLAELAYELANRPRKAGVIWYDNVVRLLRWSLRGGQEARNVRAVTEAAQGQPWSLTEAQQRVVEQHGDGVDSRLAQELLARARLADEDSGSP